MTDLLETVEITTAEPTTHPATHSVVWLHGLGASGHDFEPIVPELRLGNSPATRFVFPHAPVRPITINGGASMPGWYDISSLDFEAREQDVEGTLESAKLVTQLIEREIERGIPSENIVLAGFSQGGAIALYTALTIDKKLAGIMALSTYLPLQSSVLDQLSDQNKNIPVFMAHGQQDDVINIRYATQSRDVLENAGIKVEWQDYPMPHSVSPDEIAHIALWLKKVLVNQ